MLIRRILFGAGLVAGFLLLAPAALAGPQVRASDQSVNRAKPAPVTVSRTTSQPVSFFIVVTPPVQPAKDSLSVRLRSPDGQVRRFPVEGGASSIQIDRPIVLRPGRSVTIRWVAAK